MYKIEHHQNILLLSFHENLIADTHHLALFSALENEIEDGYQLCAVDISKVHFLNSNGLNSLIRILTLFRNNDGEMILINPSESVNQLLIITKLKAIFQITNSLEEAKKTLLHSSK
ncbi:MAG: anti-sigma factor antagonist [Cytophagia bacterium]|nr:MAG: anti-sigma factor antagonist [Cytophagales bacterium]TAG05230.1 MAG: anti-sigma factor antagonist [Cytophagia bacterium]TAG43857.1 MAG: anti-sigma factor antagonist [Cytophagia bacterium]TAH30154.1 MAG: anti-sigma factor antagonist [Cytophagales bacterium]